MTVTVKYVYTAAEGTEVVNFEDWSKTLPEAEQKEISDSLARHGSITRLKVGTGVLEVIPQSLHILGQPQKPLMLAWVKIQRGTNTTIVTWQKITLN
jgi:hypothetical protein